MIGIKKEGLATPFSVSKFGELINIYRYIDIKIINSPDLLCQGSIHPPFYKKYCKSLVLLF